MIMSEFLRSKGFLPSKKPVTVWFNNVPHVYTPGDGQGDVDWGDCHDETGAWVQSAQDAIFARLHRGDDPACDCGASDG